MAVHNLGSVKKLKRESGLHSFGGVVGVISCAGGTARRLISFFVAMTTGTSNCGRLGSSVRTRIQP